MIQTLFDHLASINRRQFLGSSATGVGLAALSSLLGAETAPRRFGPAWLATSSSKGTARRCTLAGGWAVTRRPF